MEEKTYVLPGKNNEITEQRCSTNCVIIIGANGSGKSKLGAWIEKNLKNTHRITAMRKLTFNDQISLKPYDAAEREISQLSIYRQINHKETNEMSEDYEIVLSALFGKENIEVAEFREKCKLAEANSQFYPKITPSVSDKLKLVWNAIFPQRSLILKDYKVFANYKKGDKEISYPANQMSDGERSVLYLAAQVLCAPENKTLVIDEPDIHLHSSIMNRLWTELESFRPDCLFIYITHDTSFAAIHNCSDKIWVKSYDGEHWEYEKLEENDLPEELLLDILGNRNNVLFVEGEKNSLDSALYSMIFPNYHIIPCGSCQQVISRTKAFCKCKELHHHEIYGIVDRDYRSDQEIEANKENNVFTLEVAEVENLFITEEMIRILAEHMGMNADKTFDSVKQKIIDDLFKSQLNYQVTNKVKNEIHYRFSNVNITGKTKEELKKSTDGIYASIDILKIYDDTLKQFSEAIDNEDYSQTIKLFNSKSLCNIVGSIFKLGEYPDRVISIMLAYPDKKDKIVNSLLRYIPVDIPR